MRKNEVEIAKRLQNGKQEGPMEFEKMINQQFIILLSKAQENFTKSNFTFQEIEYFEKIFIPFFQLSN